MNENKETQLFIPEIPIGNVVPIEHAHLLRKLKMINEAEKMIQEICGIDSRLMTDRGAMR